MSKASARNSRVNRSETFVFFCSEKSQFLNGGPTMLLRARLPKCTAPVGETGSTSTVFAGQVAVAFGLQTGAAIHWFTDSGMLMVPTISGRILPTPLKAARLVPAGLLAKMVNGLPLSRVRIVAISHPSI